MEKNLSYFWSFLGYDDILSAAVLKSAWPLLKQALCRKLTRLNRSSPIPSELHYCLEKS